MTDLETMHRLKLVVDNRYPQMPKRESTLQRLVYLAQLFAAAAFVLGFWWGLAVLILSLE